VSRADKLITLIRILCNVNKQNELFKLIYPVHSPTNALYINLVKSFKFTLK